MASPISFLDRFSSSIQEPMGYSGTNRRLSDAVKTKLTIAITREAGTSGTALAREIGQRLNWRVYDHELLEEIARDMGARTSLLESLDERNQSWLLDSFRAFGSSKAVTESSYVRHLIETVLTLSAHGDCVIVGRGAAFVLPCSTTIRVRLIAPLEDRIAAVCRDRECSRSEAANWVAQKDRDRRQFVRNHFNADPETPAHYDLLLNMANWTLAEASDLVLRALRLRQMHEANAGLIEVGS